VVSFSKAASGELDRAKVMWATLRWPTATDANSVLPHSRRSRPCRRPARIFATTGPVVSGATLGAVGTRATASAGGGAQATLATLALAGTASVSPGQPKAEQVETELKQFQADEESARAVGDTRRAADCRAMAERKRRLLHRLSQLPRGDAFLLQVVLCAWRCVLARRAGRELQFTADRTAGAVSPAHRLWWLRFAADGARRICRRRRFYGMGIYQESIAVVAARLEQLIESVARRIAATEKEFHEAKEIM